MRGRESSIVRGTALHEHLHSVIARPCSMEELCTACTGLIGRMSDTPHQAPHGALADFTTASQIKAAALTCMLCKVFYDSLQRMATELDLNATLQVHWLVSKSGFTFMMLDFPLIDLNNTSGKPFVNWVDLIEAAPAPSDAPLRKRYLVSYHKGEICRSVSHSSLTGVL